MRSLCNRQTILLILYATFVTPGCCYAGGDESTEEQDPFIAAKWGKIEALKLHLKKNPDLLKARNDIGATLLHYAAQRNHPELVRYLVKQGADVDALDMSKETPLYYAATWGTSFEAAKVLIELGADIDHRPSWPYPDPFKSSDGTVRTHERDYSVLERAAGSGDYRLVEFLLKKGAKIPSDSPAGKNAMHLACSRLLAWKYQNDPETAGNQKVIELLTPHIDINCIGRLGETPLNLAAKKGAVETVKYLISNSEKLGLNLSPLKLWSALHTAVDPDTLGGPAKYRAEVIKILIKAGADVNRVNSKGLTPQQLAEKLGNKTIIDAFKTE